MSSQNKNIHFFPSLVYNMVKICDHEDDELTFAINGRSPDQRRNRIWSRDRRLQPTTWVLHWSASRQFHCSHEPALIWNVPTYQLYFPDYCRKLVGLRSLGGKSGKTKSFEADLGVFSFEIEIEKTCRPQQWKERREICKSNDTFIIRRWVDHLMNIDQVNLVARISF